MQLRRQVSDGLVAPLRAELLELAREAAVEDPQLPETHPVARAGRQTVYSDGSCKHPADPLLARAAWEVYVASAGGIDRLLGGLVSGKHTP